MSGGTTGEPSESLPINPSAPTSTSDPSAPLPAQDQQPLSKNAQKRLAKAAYLEEKKRERRAAEKERKKEKKRALAEKRAAGELDEDEVGGRSNKRQKTEQGPRAPFGARIVVDLGFDDMMTENEIKSLTSQLAYTYSANRKASKPFTSLLFTSMNGRTKTRMDGHNNAAYKRWVGAEWWEDSYARLWESGTTPEGAEGREGETGVEVDPVAEEVPEGRSKPTKREPSRAEKGTVVYLTADTEDELTELKEGETYIIGGIVDHNRYKNLCLNKSKEHGIRSARLPIGTYLAELQTRKVLTVNQTFEILLKWVETRDWEQSLYAVMPKRKFNTTGRKRRGGAAGSKGEEEDCDADADGEEEDVHVLDVAALEEDGDLGEKQENA